MSKHDKTRISILQEALSIAMNALNKVDLRNSDARCVVEDACDKLDSLAARRGGFRPPWWAPSIEELKMRSEKRHA